MVARGGREETGVDETTAGTEEATGPGPGAATGAALRQAREAAGLSLADVAQRTRVPLRQLESIERGSYEALPSPTYAVGFARAYARAVGADEVAAAAGVRAELSRAGPRPRAYEPYEIADPARVPSRGLAIAAAGAALAVLVLAALWFATDLFRGGGGGVSVAVPAASPGATPVAAPTPVATTGQVRLAATGDDVWLRVYDADNKTLFLGILKPGEHFDVPADARDPMINVGRPDKLAVTLNGAAVAPLGDGDHAIKDVKVSAAALAGRMAGAAPAADASPTPVPSPSASASPRPDRASAERTSPERTASARERRDGTPRPRPSRAALSETQRANLDAAVAPPAAAATGSANP